MAFIQTVHWPSGARTYKVHYTDKAGKRRAKSYKLRKDAKFFQENIPKTTYIHDRDTVTVAEAADRWLYVCETIGRNGREPVEKATLRPYRHHVRHIKAILGGERLNALTHARCEKFREELLTNFTRIYARKILVSFKGILSQAVADNYIVANPAAGLVILNSSRDKPQHAEKIPSLAEAKSMLATARDLASSENKRLQKEWSRYYPMLLTVALGGLRPGEGLGLPWTGVHFDRGGIEVFQDLNEDMTIGRPKSKAGYRFIPMAKEGMLELKKWKLRCPKGPLGLAFPNWQGRPESGQNVSRRALRTLQERACIIQKGAPLKYTLKDLRHIRASLEIDNNANPLEIKKLMGHSSIDVTMNVYGHLFPEHDKNRARRAEKIGKVLMS
ncbi:MAG: tyrosine-type recombinase/integrase [Alphaproteobacteria bacterium]